MKRESAELTDDRLRKIMTEEIIDLRRPDILLLAHKLLTLREKLRALKLRGGSGPSHGDPGGYGTCGKHGTGPDVTVCRACFAELLEELP